MKKTYVKPVLEKVDFKFTEHIATSGETTPTTANYTGGKYNNDNSQDCNWKVLGCY